MKRVVFWFLLLVVYYLAAMYRSQPLMAFCLGTLLLTGAAFVQSRRLQKGLAVSFPRRMETAVLGREQPLSVRAFNPCFFGTGRCVLTLRAAYAGEENPGTAIRLETVIKQGENRLQFSLFAPYCGMLSVTISRLEAWDCLALFCGKKTQEETMEIAVFPPSESLSITFAPTERSADPCIGEHMGTLPSEDHHEIRQLREYRMGDRERFIHWNLSAKTGELWVKEFESENQQPATLLLVWGEEMPSLPQWSSFFRLLSALLQGLLKRFPGVVVSWREGGPHHAREEVTDANGCRDLLRKLYWLAAEENLPRYGSVPGERQGVFVLDTGLGWYWEDTLLHRFSPEGLEREIRERHFSL